MLILGLGSNVGDRLAHLRLALSELNQCKALTIRQVSPIYQSDALLPPEAPDDWNQPYLNLAIRCDTTLTPEALLPLLKEIEWRIGRKPVARHWGPRVMDIDILAWENAVIQSDALTVPHESLFERPFALWPLADVAPFWVCPLMGPHHGKTAADIASVWGSRYDGLAPFHTQQIPHRIDAPRLVGILNVTPDSFSDGGRYTSPLTALAQAKALVAAGAEIIDIGAESTAPNATLLSPEDEWARLAPVLTPLLESTQGFVIPPKFSIDTRHVSTAKRALDLGVHCINDQSGLSDPAMVELIASSDSDCVIMHHLSLPASRTHVLPPNEDPLPAVLRWAESRLQHLSKANIPLSRLIVDPGIGFGKTPAQSLQLIKHCSELRALGARVLVGHSRKSFMALFTPVDAASRDIETAVISSFLANASIDYLRIHDVDATARVLRVMKALTL